MPYYILKRHTQTKHKCIILDIGSVWAMYNSKDILGVMSQSNIEGQGSPIWQIPQQKVVRGGYYSYAIQYLQSIICSHNLMPYNFLSFCDKKSSLYDEI